MTNGATFTISYLPAPIAEAGTYTATAWVRHALFAGAAPPVGLRIQTTGPDAPFTGTTTASNVWAELTSTWTITTDSEGGAGYPLEVTVRGGPIEAGAPYCYIVDDLSLLYQR